MDINFWKRAGLYLGLIIITAIVATWVVDGTYDNVHEQENQFYEQRHKLSQQVIDSLNKQLLQAKQQAAKYCVEKEIAEGIANKSKLNQIKINQYYEKIIADINSWDAAALDSFFAVEGRSKN